MATSANPSGSNTFPAGADPDLARITEVTTPVELDDVITVPNDSLDKAPVSLEWSHKLKTKNDTYYQAVFTNTTKANAKYYLFVSSGKLEDLRKLDTASKAGGKLTIKVTTDFHYGQKDTVGKNRFLVYHDADRADMKQGRFVKAAWQKYGNMATDFIDNFKKDEDAGKVFEIIIKFVGHPLRKFVKK